MSKLKKIYTNKRIIVLLVFILLSIILINPATNSDGVAIRSVLPGSAAAEAYPQAITNPANTVKPRGREVIIAVSDKPINTVQEYYDAIKDLKLNDTFTIQTTKQKYFLTINPIYEKIETNKTETVLVNRTTYVNETNESITKEVEIEQPIYEEKIIGTQDVGITVYEKPTTNIKKGLDLEGGTRVLLKPQEEVNDDDMDIVVENIKQRLNVFGVSDITVRPTRDFFGNQFISVEIAGANEDQVKNLLTEQGEFEAKIGEKTVFIGGNKDILNVCRTNQCSYIESANTCQTDSTGITRCGFWFTITLSQEAANRQADATRDLGIIGSASGGYLTENLTLVLDKEIVDQLSISAGLKGLASTQIRITGSGEGQSTTGAHEDALESMKKLQTLLITGSLPVKLEIANVNTMSPVLGDDFSRIVTYIGLLAVLATIIVVTVRYREWKIAIPIAITMISEVVILLGFASFIGWNIDIVAIAAIIIAIGSGVDDQIVITDETLGRRKRKHESIIDWKAQLKKAFFIIMASYFTLVVAMIPLMFAGAGLLMGFAITTIAGVTIGVLVTRPAFAAILEILLEK